MKKDPAPFFFIPFLVCTGLIFLQACSKKTDTTAGINIYVAGMDNFRAKVWKNGQATTLSLSPGELASQSLGMAVSGTDVYVAGQQMNASNQSVATYWKNGSPTVLTDGSVNAVAFGVAISGSDIYVVGTRQSISGAELAICWKNGNPTVLNDSTFIAARAYSVALAGTDVYIGGECSEAIYWKNDLPVTLPGSFLNSFQVSAITTSGSGRLRHGVVAPALTPNSARH